MSKKILYMCLLLISLGFVFYLYRRPAALQTSSTIEDIKTDNLKTIEETTGLYKFDVPLEDVTIELGTDSYTNQSNYRIQVESETTGAISTEGTLNIYSLREINWEDFYVQLQGEDGMGYNEITPEQIQEHFKNTKDCIEQSEPSTTPCHTDNKYGKTFVRFEKRYDKGQFPTGVYYIYKLNSTDYVIAFYQYSSRHSRANNFKILQSIAESIR